jgi:hypothetical protein
VIALFAVGACATTPTVVDEAREYVHAGRGEEALTLLDNASRNAPNDLALRSE